MRKENVSFRANPSDINKWKKAAKDEGKTLSVFIHDMVKDRQIGMYSNKAWKEVKGSYKKLHEASGDNPSVIDALTFVAMGKATGKISSDKKGYSRIKLRDEQVNDIRKLLDRLLTLIVESERS